MIFTLNVILVLLGLLFLYTWLAYPILLGLLARRAKRRGASAIPQPTDGLPSATDAPLPFVCVILAAFNENNVIAERIHNLQTIDYPAERLRVFVGTDGCTDATADTARAAAANDCRFRILEFSDNRGKVAVLKDLVARASRQSAFASDETSLLIFSDANTMFAHDALLKLVGHFANPRIGGVCGRLIFTGAPAHGVHDQAATAENPSEEGLYWRLETKLKTWESELDSCLGANGAIYAIRPALFWTAIPTNTVVDDFVIGMKVREQGYRMLYDPSAIATEELPERRDEWVRRVRIGAGDYQALGFCRPCLSPRFGGFAWAFWSHKVLRWFTPHLAVILGCISTPLALVAYGTGARFVEALPASVTVISLTTILVAGHMGRHLGHNGHSGIAVRLCAACEHFVTMHAALFVGFIRFCRGGMSGTWKRTPRKA